MAEDQRSRRILRVVVIDLSVVLLVVGGAWVIVKLIIPLGPLPGGDYVFFRQIAERWLDTGVLYLPHQLAGPYNVTLQIDNLYPPSALFLFLPFTVLPTILWWVIPLGITGYVVAWLRPAWWSWPLLVLLVLWPKTIAEIVWGNTDMWVMAAIAGGVRWGWPFILVTLKPAFAPFALLGIRRRPFWVAGAVLGVVSLLLLPLWLEYVTAIRNMWIPADYSINSVPTMFIPVVAWLARTSGKATVNPAPADAAVTEHQLPGPAEAGSTPAAAGHP